ncbi:hypothetical protein AQ794_04585 [Burkholderia pseudomallei]|nr:hypothetical protein AQ791_10480 [Burkholderia pseudomallei]OMV41382.1 hypothetical protein AQ792_05905 [Burkholderia pseudomallei]OMV55579.1 hypothetical protein AQ793_04070 [Burkholderia pseudomallei]OMV56620.1 hypothetical protein AQ794_04585 [Burkholderia pseudomallei]OMV67014.1 hypothetical protein AQ796_14735 [Burkholderia pseudomallei]
MLDKISIRVDKVQLQFTDDRSSGSEIGAISELKEFRSERILGTVQIGEDINRHLDSPAILDS